MRCTVPVLDEKTDKLKQCGEINDPLCRSHDICLVCPKKICQCAECLDKIELEKKNARSGRRR
jgi:hypothetical protein